MKDDEYSMANGVCGVPEVSIEKLFNGNESIDSVASVL